VRSQEHPYQRQEARQPRRVRAIEHRVQLMQADEPDRDQAQRPDEPAAPVDGDHEQDRRNRGGDARAEVGAGVAPLHAPRSSARRRLAARLRHLAPPESAAARSELFQRVLEGLAREVRHSSSRKTSSL